jgi:hypothetical protein
MGEGLGTDDWLRLEAIHCQATQSVLSYTCSPEGHAWTVRFEGFRQPYGMDAAAYWEAAVTVVLKVGTMEHAVTMHMTRSHIGGDEDCPQVCGRRMKILGRKVTQILMEVRKERIWWKEASRMVTTSSDRAVLVHEDGQVTMKDGLYVWEAPPRSGKVELPAAGGGSGLLS